MVQTALAPSRARQATHRHCSRRVERGQTVEGLLFRAIWAQNIESNRKMRGTITSCAVTLLVMALSVASAGAFACQIDCAMTPAAPLTRYASTCGGRADMPGHMPDHDKGGHQHAGHTHNRILAATHGSMQQTTLQQIGLWPQTAGTFSALADVNRTHGSDIATAKPPSLIFTTPVLRI